jgi:hypothetical protein
MEAEFCQDRTSLGQRSQGTPRSSQLHLGTQGCAKHPLGDHDARVVGQQADVHRFTATLLFIENVDVVVERRMPPVMHARAKRDMGRMS